MSSLVNTPTHRMTRNQSKQLKKSISFRRQSSVYLEDKFLSNSNLDSQSTMLYLEDENIFSETGFESETISLDANNNLQIKSKKIIKKTKVTPITKNESTVFNIPTKRAISNISTMRFQSKNKKQKQKTYRMFCYQEKDLNIKQEILDLEIPHYQSDNDKQSDDDTIRHAIKHLTRSLNEAIEEQKEIKQKNEEQIQENQNNIEKFSTKRYRDEDTEEKEIQEQRKQEIIDEEIKNIEDLPQPLTRSQAKKLQNY